MTEKEINTKYILTKQKSKASQATLSAGFQTFSVNKESGTALGLPNSISISVLPLQIPTHGPECFQM